MAPLKGNNEDNRRSSGGSTAVDAVASASDLYQTRFAGSYALGSGPHATLLSERWRSGQEAGLLEILDAALEIADCAPSLPPQNTNPPRSPSSLKHRHLPRPGQGRE